MRGGFLILLSLALFVVSSSGKPIYAKLLPMKTYMLIAMQDIKLRKNFGDQLIYLILNLISPIIIPPAP